MDAGTTVEVLLENDLLLAVDKPEGMAVIPGRGDIGEPLVSLLSRQRGMKLYVVHRIDRETSGVVLFAKDPETHRVLSMSFQERQVHKRYVALAHGVIGQPGGEISRPLRQFGSGRMGVDRGGGKESVTSYAVLETYPAFTLLEAFPRTGRRHQIRVHLYSIGHPVAGDRRYGDPTSQSDIPRLMLHAAKLSLQLPDGRSVSVESPLPPSFTSVVDCVRSGDTGGAKRGR